MLRLDSQNLVLSKNPRSPPPRVARGYHQPDRSIKRVRFGIKDNHIGILLPLTKGAPNLCSIVRALIRVLPCRKARPFLGNNGEEYVLRLDRASRSEAVEVASVPLSYFEDSLKNNCFRPLFYITLFIVLDHKNNPS